MRRKTVFIVSGLLLLVSVFFLGGRERVSADTVTAADIYPALPYKEFLLPLDAHYSCHAASVAELPNGELFAVWYAPPKKSQHSVVWGSRRPVGAAQWATPTIITYAPGYSDKNPVLYVGRDNTVFLFWAIEKRWLRLVRDAVYVKTSVDFGRTWSKERAINTLTWFLPRTHPLRLRNGDVVLPVYTDLSTSAAAAISKDGGLTWGAPRYILFFFGIQPTIIERSDGSLYTLMRCGMPPRMAWQATSTDSGRNWKDRKYSTVYNPGTSLEMVKLRNGHVVLACNDSKKDLRRLILALSLDEGRTWPYKRIVESDTKFPNTYPSVIQDSYGLIHVLYSYNGRQNIAHFVTDEEWIKGGTGYQSPLE